MRTFIVRFLSTLGVLLVLFIALVALIRFYPYNYNFSAYPKVTQTQSGAAGDPLNLVFVGSKDQIMQSFRQAGWLIPDPLTPQTSAKIAADSQAHRSYPTAPLGNLYVFGRVQDLAFEKPTSDVQNRGHVRLWQTEKRIDGQPIWVGQASYDDGIQLNGANRLPTHHIAPTVDLERNSVGSDLATTGLVKEKVQTAFSAPILFAWNENGDYYTSDGDALVINYTQTPIQLTQPATVISGLKNNFFLLYDTTLTALGPLLPLLVIVLALVVGFALWRLRTTRRTRQAGRVHHPGRGPIAKARSRLRKPDHGARIAKKHGKARSSEWGRVEKEHLLREPACLACGHKGHGLQVHHIKPFHLHPQLELDPNNLMTLCEIKGRDHHLLLGHLDEWESYNENVKSDVKHFYGMTAAQIKAHAGWQKKVKMRP